MTKMVSNKLTDETKPWVCAYLHIRGHSLDPGHITDLLLVEPTKTRVLGQSTGSVKPIIAKNGYWSLRSIKFISTHELDINKHLDVLLRLPKINLLEVDGVEEAEVDIHVLSADEDTRPIKTMSFEINHEHLCVLSELGIKLSVTVS